MGVKRLKIKDEVSYRRGLASKCCEFCKHYVSDFEIRGAKEPRCKVIGLKEGRGYRVNRNSLCDRYEEYQGGYHEIPLHLGQ